MFKTFYTCLKKIGSKTGKCVDNMSNSEFLTEKERKIASKKSKLISIKL